MDNPYKFTPLSSSSPLENQLKAVQDEIGLQEGLLDRQRQRRRNLKAIGARTNEIDAQMRETKNTLRVLWSLEKELQDRIDRKPVTPNDQEITSIFEDL